MTDITKEVPLNAFFRF